MKKYILKEYGSWGVMILSFLTGILAGGGFSPAAAAAFVSLALYVNSKQAMTLWLRGKSGRPAGLSLVFGIEILLATLLMFAALSGNIIPFIPYIAVPVAYLVLFRVAGEHAIVTEIAGFLLLTLSAPVARFSVEGVLDVRLYIAVAVFFTAGVFKVRVQLARGKRERVLMVFYVLLAVAVYLVSGLPLIALLPLADNLAFAATLYRARLRTAGRLELAKGALFVLLMAAAYPSGSGGL